MVEQIRKLKAGLSVLIGTNEDVITKSKELYLSFATIKYQDLHIERDKLDFESFMEREEITEAYAR